MHSCLRRHASVGRVKVWGYVSHYSKGMKDPLQTHTPSDTVKRKAANRDIDLEALKRDDPQRYAMINAQPLLRVATSIGQLGSGIIQATYPRHQLFTVPGSETGQETLAIFPPLSPKELEHLDKAFARLVTQGPLAEERAYFRVVKDMSGEMRELGVPVAPATYQQQSGVMVGPFDLQEEAEHWGEKHAQQAGFAYDALDYNGAWYCDVFRHES